MIPLYLFMTLGTAAEISQLLALRWAIDVRSVLLHCCIAAAIVMFPVWYSVAWRMAYPVNCPVGRVGWVLIGLLSGIGSSGLQAMWQFSKVQNGLNSSDMAIQTERTTIGWMLSSFVITYVIGCLSFWFLIRMQGGSRDGLLHLIALIAIIKFASAHYFAGKMFGRHKLIPSISPGKTIEGLVGGMLLSMAVAYFFLRGAAAMVRHSGWRICMGPGVVGFPFNDGRACRRSIGIDG